MTRDERIEAVRAHLKEAHELLREVLSECYEASDWGAYHEAMVAADAIDATSADLRVMGRRSAP